eukprot:GHVT01029464.1.p1 GENE.GHVT01029464.1~~GHVT01029464.1.p1  ORF type:complete len:407 (-),score=59.80 GHVT01029464.1:504-1724(-)
MRIEVASSIFQFKRIYSSLPPALPLLLCVRIASLSDSSPSAGDCVDFVAKLLNVPPARTDDGRAMAMAAGGRTQAAAEAVTAEVKVLIDHLNLRIFGSGSGDVSTHSILPLVHTTEVKRTYKRQPDKPDWSAATFCPFMERGSVEFAAKALAGRRPPRLYADDLLLGNLKRLIDSLASLERVGVFHGNIRPSNLFVSNDGYSLLLGDFVPPCILYEWYCSVGLGLSTASAFFSPELYDSLCLRKITKRSWLAKEVDQHKSDVYALGKCFLYLTTFNKLKSPLVTSEEISAALDEMDSKRDQELVKLIRKMMTFDPKLRPRWNDLLPPPSDSHGGSPQYLSMLRQGVRTESAHADGSAGNKESWWANTSRAFISGRAWLGKDDVEVTADKAGGSSGKSKPNDGCSIM